MRHTIHKLFWVWDFDKEEKWLNEMAARGFALVSVGFCKYEFEDCVPGEYRICLQLLDKLPRHPESRKYIEFLESTGAQHVGSFTRWAYFRKKADEDGFALFSENLTRMEYLTGIIRLVGWVTAMNLFIGIVNLTLAVWLRHPGSEVNYLGLLNLVLGVWGIFGCCRLLKKRNIMKKESRLFE